MSSNKRIILITGANNGIGFETAAALATASSKNHVLVAARSRSKGEQAIKNIQARNPVGTLSLVELDVTSDASIAAAAKQIETEFGRLDVLVNNAGICTLHTVADTTREILHSTFDANVYGPMLLTNAVAPLLKKSKDPRIINVSSTMGSITLRSDHTDPLSANNLAEAYRMSKAALNMLTATLNFEFKDWPTPCKVWSFCPGFVVTDLGARDDGTGSREWKKNNGAENPETSAEGIRQIVDGERDGEVGKFVQRFGKQGPW
ncbi:NAD(P)-binding protein [Westerdykella ornata]|uniref:NAD(P)-binding protein n=1 Tax=Westerdykella ornata TaxID=318751 RepID=A0A6A6JPI8_WESOR|nr:NAD(P)-binding protein [Westerdykella ornata]KAF2276869.1 NAD(P)-binding protein [Westerdykella ornata]